MATMRPYLEFTLHGKEAVSLHHLAGCFLTAVDSHLWLTEEAGGRDVWLAPGDRYRIRGHGRLVVEPWLPAEAISDAVAKVRLSPRRGTHRLVWVVRWLRLMLATRLLDGPRTAILHHD